MQPRRRPFGEVPQPFIKNNIEPPPRLAIKQRSLLYRRGKTFLQTHRLRTELHQIRIVCLRFPPLVLHRKRLPRTVSRCSSTTSATPCSPSASDRNCRLRVMRMPGRDSPRPSSTFSCNTRPSAVNRFSSHSRSRWISAHCRSQNSRCCKAERGRESVMVGYFKSQISDFKSVPPHPLPRDHVSVPIGPARDDPVPAFESAGAPCHPTAGRRLLWSAVSQTGPASCHSNAAAP